MTTVLKTRLFKPSNRGYSPAWGGLTVEYSTRLYTSDDSPTEVKVFVADNKDALQGMRLRPKRTGAKTTGAEIDGIRNLPRNRRGKRALKHMEHKQRMALQRLATLQGKVKL